MKRAACILLACLLCITSAADAKLVKTFWIPTSIAIAPFVGIGDFVSNVIVYHSSFSCFKNNNSSTVALIKDLGTGIVNTTLGCNTVGQISVTGGSPLATTCTGVAGSCYIDTWYDQSGFNNCSGGPCSTTNTSQAVGNLSNPSYVINCVGTSNCAHFQGWSNGNSQPIASSSYNNGTGVVTLTMSNTSYFLSGGGVIVAGITGTGSVGQLNGNFVTISPTNSTTITYQIGSGLTLTTNSNTGNVSPSPQTLNNNVGTFATVAEPFTVFALYTCDNFQNAGTSGGPNSSQTQHDSTINVGCSTSLGTATLEMTNGGTPATSSSGVSYQTSYSVVATFDNTHNNSWFCVNGVCNSVNLSNTLSWANGAAFNNGWSIGNGSGGWGGDIWEAGMIKADAHTQALSIYANQEARYGAFGNGIPCLQFASTAAPSSCMAVDTNPLHIVKVQ